MLSCQLLPLLQGEDEGLENMEDVGDTCGDTCGDESGDGRGELWGEDGTFEAIVYVCLKIKTRHRKMRNT